MIKEKIELKYSKIDLERAKVEGMKFGWDICEKQYSNSNKDLKAEIRRLKNE